MANEPTPTNEDTLNRPARCPVQLLGEGPRCKALVLVRDALEHEAWHERLDALLEAPVEVQAGISVDRWPAAGQQPTAPGPAPESLGL